MTVTKKPCRHRVVGFCPYCEPETPIQQENRQSHKRHRAKGAKVAAPDMAKVLSGVDASRRAAWAQKYEADERVAHLEWRVRSLETELAAVQDKFWLAERCALFFAAALRERRSGHRRTWLVWDYMWGLGSAPSELHAAIRRHWKRAVSEKREIDALDENPPPLPPNLRGYP